MNLHHDFDSNVKNKDYENISQLQTLAPRVTHIDPMTFMFVNLNLIFKMMTPAIYNCFFTTIKFTQISRTVWTFAKKTEISQNAENFHPWKILMKIYLTSLPLHTFIMKRKFHTHTHTHIHTHTHTQWCSTMSPISSKHTISLSPQLTEHKKKPWHRRWKSRFWLETCTKMWRTKLVNGIRTLSLSIIGF